MMRITFATQKDTALLSFNQNQDEINRLTTAISTGNKFTSPGDDPSSWSQSMDFRQGVREYDSILNNIDYATGWNQSTDSALNQVSNLISQAKQAAVEAEGPAGMNDPSALVSSLDGVIQQMLTAVNSQYGDQYIFSGTAGSTTPPFTLDDTTGVVTYSGDSGQINVRTDKGGTGSFTVNLSGDQAFNFQSGGSTLNVIQEVWQLKQAISTGDTTTIEAKLGTLDTAFQYIGEQSVITGSRESTLAGQKSAIDAFKTDSQTRLSDLSDTDMADAITQLQQHKTAYQAALQVTGMMDNLSLLNYIPV
jgi:flagellar hook-associated protein 3 FlgL